MLGYYKLYNSDNICTEHTNSKGQWGKLLYRISKLYNLLRSPITETYAEDRLSYYVD